MGANRQRREQLLTQSSVATLAWFLCKGSLDVRINAATVLAGIASETESSHSSSIGAMSKVLEALAKLLREEFYPKAIRADLKALLTICIPRRNRIRVVEVGVVPLLVKLLPDAKRSNVELALGVLELLCTTTKGRAAVANHALTWGCSSAPSTHSLQLGYRTQCCNFLVSLQSFTSLFGANAAAGEMDSSYVLRL